MTDNADIKSMASLLREGATMMDLTCPVCDNILFRLKDKTIWCPTCKKTIVIQNEIGRNVKTNLNKKISEQSYSDIEEIQNKIFSLMKTNDRADELLKYAQTLEILERIQKKKD